MILVRRILRVLQNLAGRSEMINQKCTDIPVSYTHLDVYKRQNVVSPDDLVRDYGCDSLRMYELFVGPPELDAEWDDRGIDGVNRFLKRFWNLVMDSKDANIEATKEMIKERHKLAKDITTRLESFSLNTAISGFMEHNNKLIEIAKKAGGIDTETLSTMAVLLSPFAPHIAEEVWEQLGHEGSVFKAG